MYDVNVKVICPGQDEKEYFYERGKFFMTQMNMFNIFDGKVVTSEFWISTLYSALNFLVINKETYPCYNIENEYMGYIFRGEFHSIPKRRKKRRVNQFKALSVVALVLSIVLMSIGIRTGKYDDIILGVISAVISIRNIEVPQRRGQVRWTLGRQ